MTIAKKQLKTIISVIISVGVIGGGAVMLDKDIKQKYSEQNLFNLIEKQKNGTLNYHEYLELAEAYNVEIKKRDGIEFEKVHTRGMIINRINDKILE